MRLSEWLLTHGSVVAQVLRPHVGISSYTEIKEDELIKIDTENINDNEIIKWQRKSKGQQRFLINYDNEFVLIILCMNIEIKVKSWI